MATTPYQENAAYLELQRNNLNSRLKAIQSRPRRSDGNFINVADMLQNNNLIAAIAGLEEKLKKNRGQYQTYNNALIKANTQGLGIDYANALLAVEPQLLANSDRYIYNSSQIANNTTQANSTLLQQQLKMAQELANKQREGVIIRENGQAGIVAGISTRAGLNAGQMLAGQQEVNNDKAAQLAAIDQSEFGNVSGVQNNQINQQTNLGEIERNLELQRLNSVNGVSNTAFQLQLAQIARQQQLADAAKKSTGGGGGSGSAYNTSGLPRVPASTKTTSATLAANANAAGFSGAITPIQLNTVNGQVYEVKPGENVQFMDRGIPTWNPLAPVTNNGTGNVANTQINSGLMNQLAVEQAGKKQNLTSSPAVYTGQNTPQVFKDLLRMSRLLSEEELKNLH